MAQIRQLDPHVADLIAAGEVVERPASVVKELMENAIDAGAHAVTVEIAHGGMTLIRVTDDGCGIPADQAATAFLRHATSKIATEFDLEAIGTLGFRGEALAAIAAVSRVELLTRPPEDTLGTALTLEGGQVLEQEEAGCPAGTTMVVRDLFFNTPARQKFLKKGRGGGSGGVRRGAARGPVPPGAVGQIHPGRPAGAAHPRGRAAEERGLRRHGQGNCPGAAAGGRLGDPYGRVRLCLHAQLLPGQPQLPALFCQRPVREEPHHDGGGGRGL